VSSKVWKRAQELELAFWQEGCASGRTPSNSTPEHSRLIWERFGVTPKDWAGKVILDVGCGPTARLWCFAARSTIAAIDPLMAHYAELPGGSLQSYQLRIEGRAESFCDSYEQSFDVVVCLNTLDHTDRPPLVVENMFRYCKPGGIGVLSTDCNRMHDAMHPHAFHHYEVETMILDAGWTIVKRARGKSFPMMNEDGIAYWMEGWSPGATAYHWWLRRPKTEELQTI